VWQSLEPTAGFSAEELAAYEHARLAHLHKYLRAGAPLVLVGHLGAAVYFNALAPSSPAQTEWLHTMVRLHTIAACFVVVVLLAINTSTKKIRASRPRTALFEAALRFYPLFGALMSANAQRTHGSYGFFVVCIMGAATAAIDVRSAALLYGAASGILAVAIALLQQDPRPARRGDRHRHLDGDPRLSLVPRARAHPRQRAALALVREERARGPRRARRRPGARDLLVRRRDRALEPSPRRAGAAALQRALARAREPRRRRQRPPHHHRGNHRRLPLRRRRPSQHRRLRLAR
jgi:hypothetical protein